MDKIIPVCDAHWGLGWITTIPGVGISPRDGKDDQGRPEWESLLPLVVQQTISCWRPAVASRYRPNLYSQWSNASYGPDTDTSDDPSLAPIQKVSPSIHSFTATPGLRRPPCCSTSTFIICLHWEWCGSRCVVVPGQDR